MGYTERSAFPLVACNLAFDPDNEHSLTVQRVFAHLVGKIKDLTDFCAARVTLQELSLACGNKID